MKPSDIYFILANVYLAQSLDNSTAILMAALTFVIALYFNSKVK